MPGDSERRTMSIRPHGARRSRLLFPAILFVLFETATCTAAFPQSAAAPDTISRVSLGVLIDTSAHQKEVIDFQRDVIRGVADGFGSVKRVR
jgi:hypothetical protein